MSETVTFFICADLHFGYRMRFGREDQRRRSIETMRRLAGWPYPAAVGGVVGRPEFLVNLGDMVDGTGDATREFDYYRYFMRDLPWPRYETLGNHDWNNRDFMADFRQRYGGTSHAFDGGACRFIALANGPGDEVPENDLDFLETELSLLAKKRPLIILTHAHLGMIRNRDDVLTRLRGQPVVLALAGHLHRHLIHAVEGIPVAELGQIRDHPVDSPMGRNFAVAELSATRFKLVYWRWDLNDWEQGQGWDNPPRRPLHIDRQLRPLQ